MNRTIDEVSPAMPAPILSAPAPEAAQTMGGLLGQLKGTAGMVMGMGGVALIVAAFAVGRMAGPRATQAAPAAEPPSIQPAATVQTPPAPLPAHTATPTRPAAPSVESAPTQPSQAAAKAESAQPSDPWSKLLR